MSPIKVNLTFYPDGLLGSTTWLYGAEVLPMSIRSKVMGIASATHFIVNVGSEWSAFLNRCLCVKSLKI